MLDSQLLKAKLVEKSLTLEKTAEKMGITKSTLSKKVNGLCDFKFCEIDDLSTILELSQHDIMRIFFGRFVASNENN